MAKARGVRLEERCAGYGGDMNLPQETEDVAGEHHHRQHKKGADQPAQVDTEDGVKKKRGDEGTDQQCR